MSTANRQFDPETLAVLRAVFEEACGSLPPHRRTRKIRSELAVRILKLAGRGALDSAQLRTYALIEAGGISVARRPEGLVRFSITRDASRGSENFGIRVMSG